MKIITIIDFVMITKKRQAYQPIIFNISYFTQKTGYTIFLFEPFRTKNYLKEVDYKKEKNFVILFKRYVKGTEFLPQILILQSLYLCNLMV